MTSVEYEPRQSFDAKRSKIGQRYRSSQINGIIISNLFQQCITGGKIFKELRVLDIQKLINNPF